MTTITINNYVYNVLPLYDLYAACNDGNIINIIKKVPLQGHKHLNGYIGYMVRKHAQKGKKKNYIHRFVWECFNSVIQEGKVIDHINTDKEDNRLCNLQLVTQQQNCKNQPRIVIIHLLQKIIKIKNMLKQRIWRLM